MQQRNFNNNTVIYVDAETGEISEDRKLSGINVLKIKKDFNNIQKVYHDKGVFYVPESYNMNEIIKVYNDKIKTTKRKG